MPRPGRPVPGRPTPSSGTAAVGPAPAPPPGWPAPVKPAAGAAARPAVLAAGGRPPGDPPPGGNPSPRTPLGADRDGLRLDQLHVPLGPVLPDWPAGLVVHLTLQGDVVQHAEVQAVGPGGSGRSGLSRGAARRPE